MRSFKSDYLDIFATQSTTYKTEEMMSVIESHLGTIPNVTFTKDAYGNLYATKGKAKTYPAYVCHTDTVHKIYESFYVQQTDLNYLYAYTQDNGFMQVGVGGDDKCGIVACIELLTRLKVVKCAFFLDEEQGCKGSSAGDLSFFDNCRFAVQIDRKGSEDIITTGSGITLASTEFIEELTTLGAKYKYAPTTGSSTDVVKLKERGLGIAACNLSAGYYNPHTKQEYVDLDALMRCISLCLDLSKLRTVFNHTYTAPPTKSFAPFTKTYSTITSQSPCASCGKGLRYDEAYLCSACISADIENIYNVYTESPIIDHNTCKVCRYVILDQKYLKDGVCDACSKCFWCGGELTNATELADNICTTCEARYNHCKGCGCNAKGDYCAECYDPTMYCATVDCDRELLNYMEQEDGFCRFCTYKMNV